MLTHVILARKVVVVGIEIFDVCLAISHTDSNDHVVILTS